MAQTYDVYDLGGTQDTGAGSAAFPPGAPVAGSGNPATTLVQRVSNAAGAGTALDIQIPIGYKSRIVDAFLLVTTGVASSTVQLWTGAGGTGTACSSAMSSAATGKVRDNLTTASQVIAMGGTLYARLSGGATLAGVDVVVITCPEQ